MLMLTKQVIEVHVQVNVHKQVLVLFIIQVYELHVHQHVVVLLAIQVDEVHVQE